MSVIPIVEVFYYDGKLKNNVVLDCVIEMDKYFEYESTHNKKNKKEITNLKVMFHFGWFI